MNRKLKKKRRGISAKLAVKSHKIIKKDYDKVIKILSEDDESDDSETSETTQESFEEISDIDDAFKHYEEKKWGGSGSDPDPTGCNFKGKSEAFKAPVKKN